MANTAELPPTNSELHAEWRTTAEGFDIPEPVMTNMERVLGDLRDHHHPTYEHSLRVAMLAVRIAEVDGLPPKALFYAGTMHDRGKLQVPVETLSKTDSWTEADTEALKPHPMVGYEELMAEGMGATAVAVALHHTFQPRGYPEAEPEADPRLPHPLVEQTKVWSRRLALADYYDASHRKNSAGNLNGEEIRQKVYEHNPDLTELIDRLYAEGVFSEN